MEAAQKAANLPVFVLDAVQWRDARKEHNSNEVEVLANRFDNGRPMQFVTINDIYANGPHILVLEGSEENPLEWARVTAQAVHYFKIGSAWVTKPRPEEVARVLHSHGYRSSNVRSSNADMLRVGWFYRPEEILSTFESLNYAEYAGIPPTEIEAWLDAVIPARVRQYNPSAVDYIMTQYSTPPHELTKAGWFKEPISKKSSMEETMNFNPKHDWTDVFSVVSIPKDGLDSEIWNLDGDEPVLKADYKDHIITFLMDGLKKLGFSAPERWIARVLVIGGITSNQYDEDSDIDVTLIIDYDAFREAEGDTITGESLKQAWRATDPHIADRTGDAVRDILAIYADVIAPSAIRIAAKGLEEATRGVVARGRVPWTKQAEKIAQQLTALNQSMRRGLLNRSIPIYVYPRIFKEAVLSIAEGLDIPEEEGVRIADDVAVWMGENIKTAVNYYPPGEWVANVFPYVEKPDVDQ
jgi:hypothetical protein